MAYTPKEPFFPFSMNTNPMTQQNGWAFGSRTMGSLKIQSLHIAGWAAWEALKGKSQRCSISHRLEKKKGKGDYRKKHPKTLGPPGSPEFGVHQYRCYMLRHQFVLKPQAEKKETNTYWAYVCVCIVYVYLVLSKEFSATIFHLILTPTPTLWGRYDPVCHRLENASALLTRKKCSSRHHTQHNNSTKEARWQAAATEQWEPGRARRQHIRRC